MFKSIRIRNFKSFDDSGEVHLAPLTLLLGVNSGGKSSLLQPLRVLGQSVQQGNRAFFRYFPLTTNGPYVQLGDYREFVRGHDIRRRNQWDFTVTSDMDLYRSPTIRRKIELSVWPAEIAYRIQVAATNKGEDVVVGSTRIELPGYRASFTRDAKGTTWGLRGRTISSEKPDRQQPPLTDIGLGSTVTSRADERSPKDADLELASELHSLANRSLSLHYQRLRYAPPYREVPQRVYIASPAAPSEDPASQARRLLRRPAPAAFVKNWLTRFGVAKDIDTNRLVEGLLILRLTDSTTAVRSNLADFGFGTSQLLPLLIDLSEAAAPTSQTLPTSHVIQQPEVHLHPAAQSILGDLFVEVVKDGRQLFVETHSEHLVYKVQRLIAEGRIAHTDVAILYVDKGEAGSRITPIDLTENGTFRGNDGLPPGFLDTGIHESMQFQRALSRSYAP